LLPPVVPSKIVCVGRNYADHAKELGNEAPSEPILFLKPPSALLAPGGTIVRPPQSQLVHHEAELAIVVGREAKNVKADRWRDYVRGFSCANDVTARDLQREDKRFTRAKGFDTFCPVGKPHVASVTVDQLSALEVVTRVNGTQRQHGKSSDMAFSIPFLLSYISHIMTLEPGDLVATGTPAGVGKLAEGDIVEVEIVGLSMVTNPVAAPSV
jgi:2-keto-4-pentenoate hydratase/2-oxohepta-3-ene-1,7-dioic acid hydratase in catechol pathway